MVEGRERTLERVRMRCLVGTFQGPNVGREKSDYGKYLKRELQGELLHVDMDTSMDIHAQVDVNICPGDLGTSAYFR